MKIAPDTTVLVRAATDDDPAQAHRAREIMANAEEIHLTLPVLCEFVWVMTSRYGRTPTQVLLSLRALLAIPTAQFDAEAVGVGLAMLDRGGDFADGVIAAEGARMGAATFVSFDRKAVRDVKAQGLAAQVVR